MAPASASSYFPLHPSHLPGGPYVPASIEINNVCPSNKKIDTNGGVTFLRGPSFASPLLKPSLTSTLLHSSTSRLPQHVCFLTPPLITLAPAWQSATTPNSYTLKNPNEATSPQPSYNIFTEHPTVDSTSTVTSTIPRQQLSVFNRPSSSDIGSSPHPPYYNGADARQIQYSKNSFPAESPSKSVVIVSKAKRLERPKGPVSHLKAKALIKIEPKAPMELRHSPRPVHAIDTDIKKQPRATKLSRPPDIPLTNAAYIDLRRIWNENPSIPTTSSIAAWAAARNLRETRVVKWFKGKRYREKAAGKPHEGSYELSVDAPGPTTSSTDHVAKRELPDGVVPNAFDSETQTARMVQFSNPQKRCKRTTSVTRSSGRSLMDDLLLKRQLAVDSKAMLVQPSSIPVSTYRKRSLDPAILCTSASLDSQLRVRKRCKIEAPKTAYDTVTTPSAKKNTQLVAKKLSGDTILDSPDVVSPPNEPKAALETSRPTLVKHTTENTTSESPFAILPEITQVEDSRFRKADITFVLPSSSWGHLSSIRLLLQWETDALVECLTKPTKNPTWETQILVNKFDLNTLAKEIGWSMDPRSDLNDDLEFTPEQLNMMVELNRELEECRSEG
ncbi:hypothetical protein K439DRAFT_1616388 [Ramaria rubella]|nr:hypothetical protein K439DRAFT_1616388 [Ramaria rubella]